MGGGIQQTPGFAQQKLFGGYVERIFRAGGFGIVLWEKV
jgi:hypothetical protein